MPYDTSEAKLEELIKLAISSPATSEIFKNFRKTGWTLEQLMTEVKSEARNIWPTVKSQTDEYERLEGELKAATEKFDKEKPPEPVAPKSSSFYPPDWVPMSGIGSLGVLILGVLAIIVLGFIYGWRNVFYYLLIHKVLFGGIAASLVLWGLVTLLLDRRAGRKFDDAYNTYTAVRAEWDIKSSMLSRPVVEYRQRLANLKQTIEKTLIDGAITKRLTTLINSRLAESYETKLKILGAKGFAEVFNPEYAIDTSAQESLDFLLKNMPGGSIGIAGPRGAGKSTLLRLFCGPKRTIQNLQGLPVLAVLVSAPVEYQGRDFILYLFSSVCQSLLEMERVKYGRPALEISPSVGEARESAQSNLVEPLKKLLRPVPKLCFYLGAALIALSLLMASLLAVYGTNEAGQQASDSTQAAQRTATSQPQATQAQQPDEPQTSSPQTSQPQPSPTASPAPERQPPRVPFAINLIKALAIQPGTILMWGLFIMAAGILIVPLLGGRVSIFLIYRILGYRLGDALFGRYVERLRERDMERKKRERIEDDAPIEPEVGGLAGEALAWLKNIKFQQSYTTGWSGALKLPVGLEGGIQSAVTLSQNQLSLPEIVHFFIKFLESISSKYKVIIGIDELDKLASDDHAQQFLNEIKSVFGVDNCFYLVTVSENAMSNFERRGLPFRDVFDSSFDNIIYVDYLDFQGAKSLIEERVVGRPVPFFALSYSLSGGLARDIIRTFRSMIELQEPPPGENDLETLGRKVIQADIKAKIRATVISAKKVDLEDEVDSLLEKLYAAEEKVVSEKSLLKAARQLLASLLPCQAEPTQNGDKEIYSKRARVNALTEEIATYLYYSVTLLEFFTNSLSQDALTNPKRGGSLDDLAKARQLLAINPAITRKLLYAFRKAHKLPPLPPRAAYKAGRARRVNGNASVQAWASLID